MREKGYIVSSNIAPASRTESVMKQKLLKAAYDGSAYFDINIFDLQKESKLQPGKVSNPDLYNQFLILLINFITAHPRTRNTIRRK